MNTPTQTVDELPKEGGSPETESPPVPERIGRYQINRLLGQGGFGIVYLAHDEQLHRLVAIKVPHRKLVPRPEDAEAYLTEARTVASLDHPNIVPVYDVGSVEDCPCFVVSKFIEGCTLAQRVKEKRFSVAEAAELVATVAETLQYAHRKGLVHRDIKPGNILLDAGGKPYVADFGLALKEENVGHGPKYAGTPAYMSPEQARGEGHRVDGRSDVFSLSVVFYQLLAGRQPFRAESRTELLEQITTLEPGPPRQIDDSIPKELERICLKALSKRASDRYTTAKDMADDLRHFLAEKDAGPVTATMDLRSVATATAPGPPATRSTPPTTPTSDAQVLKIVPKGLRSFDAHDADFFLELLPGPRGREGLPDSIRFWKTRLEETDPEKTFAVGLICGPSGCGKSSLVKAGLLPHLAEDVLVVYLEATAKETETRLLNGLRKRCPVLPANLGLKETLAALRRGQGIPVGKKVLIVLDQFEQWLHAKKEEENTELVQALRQCDGSKVQGIVMVRDDFWMAVIRFMRELENHLVEGQNSAAVDLFPIRHAEKVLAAFGRAFGVLPGSSTVADKEQKQFLERAVSGLAQEGKVICVRLALFAEMMKGRPWTPATLKEVGGTEGVGVTFLEETFSAASAPPEHRYHQKAARAVLKALLPEAGADIKGHMRSQAELLEASGYASRPKDFDDLIRLLDGEIRLITPTDPEGAGTETQQRQPSAGGKYYQLTHDYLVHSLRDWLTRKQKETRRGRAELLLADRASVWKARPETRQLPSLWQWLSIRWWTRKKDWSPPQRRMMRKASRHHSLRVLMAALVLALAGWGGYEAHGMLKAQALKDRLLDADINEVPTIVRDMAPYRRWLDPLLREASQEAAAKQEPRKQLHASLALLPVDPNQKEYLYRQLLDAAPHEVPVLRDALAPHKDALLDKLWSVVRQPDKGREQQRLRAACALAAYDPESERWAKKVQEDIANDLVREPAVYLATWMDALRPVRGKMLSPLSAVFRDGKRRETERSLATDILADYAADQPQVLADLVMDADEKQFAVLFPKLKDHGERGLAFVQDEVDKQLPPGAKEDAKEMLAKRQANAGVALLKMNFSAKVWPLLKHSPDPRLRSYLIHRLGPLGVDARVIVKRLEDEPDVTIRRALILSLGEFGDKEWPSASRDDDDEVMEKMREIYRTADDPGLHASAEWLLRHWEQDDWLERVDEELVNKEQREKRLEHIKQELTRDKEKAKPRWYVNGQGQTMVVIPGPVVFMMGSPPTEDARFDNEVLHKKRINRTFALAAKPVTVGQYQRFDKNYTFIERYAPKPSCPVSSISWYQAAAYCNWLSEKEGIPKEEWGYETTPQGQVTKLKENYLSLTGYRLPTEAEWEYGCRAGSVTSRYYGESEELLGKYAWYLSNSLDRTWPVGTKKPNDLGLFDLHGNVWCWCQESQKAYPEVTNQEVIEDKEDVLSIVSTTRRILRGGALNTNGLFIRSANRYWNVPTYPGANVGFRPARTLR